MAESPDHQPERPASIGGGESEANDLDPADHADKITPETRERMTDLLAGLTARIMALDDQRQIKEFVTRQVASEVLWCYGDFEGDDRAEHGNGGADQPDSGGPHLG